MIDSIWLQSQMGVSKPHYRCPASAFYVNRKWSFLYKIRRPAASRCATITISLELGISDPSTVYQHQETHLAHAARAVPSGGTAHCTVCSECVLRSLRLHKHPDRRCPQGLRKASDQEKWNQVGPESQNTERSRSLKKTQDRIS
ncbi:hypothetical protein RRG08_043807 [Elysia crispata]|uniref:Uncharacterized protein n=1 Tax=Elysia crispata TaxID=231223 RepID=A0AAE0Z4Y6_9GAST|nr:hypothetical protein RRG08_043807 [Elysia crispata]